MKNFFKKIYKGSANEFYDLVKQNIINNNKMFIITANPETLMTAKKNCNLRDALLDNNTTIIADGIGIVKTAKFFKYTIKESIPGIELCIKLLEFCNEFNKSIYFFGSKEKTIKNLIFNVKNKYPNLTISGYKNGYIKNKQDAFEEIKKLKPDVVLVALGVPQQELIIYDNIEELEKGIFVGVGGSFDVLSGLKKRAPRIFRVLHLEWLYRIIVEPKRLKRFFKNNIKYLLELKVIKN